MTDPRPLIMCRASTKFSMKALDVVIRITWLKASYLTGSLGPDLGQDFLNKI